MAALLGGTMGFNNNDVTKEVRGEAKAASDDKDNRAKKCACGLRTYQKDGVCIICKRFGFEQRRAA